MDDINNKGMLRLEKTRCNLKDSLFQIRGANPCESLKLHLVFSNLNIPLLLMSSI